MKVTRNEWLLRFRQGKSTVNDDDDDVLRVRRGGRIVDDDDDDDAVDNVDAVDIARVLGFPLVETVDTDDVCGGRRVRIVRRRRGGTMCHVSITASSIIVYVCGLLFSLHERAI